MTAPAGPIIFNNSTGSDTAASGLGPATAVTGTAAAHTNGAASTTITLTNSPDLSGVTAGHLLWLNTASGRQFSVIASVDDGADTVTVDDSFNIASGSAVDYAIGGKRSTIDNADSRTLFGTVGWKDGWKVEIEYTGSNYLITGSVISVGSNTGYFLIRATGGRVVVEQQANAGHFHGANNVFSTLVVFKGFHFINSNATKTLAVVLGATDGYDIYAEDCIFGSTVSGERVLCACSRTGGSESRNFSFMNCLIQNTTGNGIGNGNQNVGYVLVRNTVIDGCAAAGIRLGDPAGSLFVNNSVIKNNATDGILPPTTYCEVVNTIFYGNGGDGIDLAHALSEATIPAALFGNMFIDNGGYGVNAIANQDLRTRFNDYNAYYSNTSGEVNNISNGANDITLSADPFVDAVNGDFNINNTAGGGASLRAATLAMPA